jgi:hypothetical protein
MPKCELIHATRPSASASHVARIATLGPVIADADADIAALVYTPQEHPDLVLSEFARRLRRDGRKVCGLVQFRGLDAHGRRRLLVLDRRRSFDVCSAVQPDSRYHIDAAWLDRLARRVETEIERGVDLAIASRFGPLERAGRGFFDVLRRASQTLTPLLIAVPRADFPGWTHFSAGMTVRLGCSLEDVTAWWRGLSERDPRAGRPRGCEMLK